MSNHSDGAVQQAHCDRCGTVGTHLVCITANRDGGMENWKPLCDGCLKALGEWFNEPGAGHSPHDTQRGDAHE